MCVRFSTAKPLTAALICACVIGAAHAILRNALVGRTIALCLSAPLLGNPVRAAQNPVFEQSDSDT